MTGEYRGKKFLTDEDLKVSVLGIWPRVDIKNSELQKYFQQNLGRNFLGGDELVSYAQSLVSGGMSFDTLEEEILADSKNQEQTLREIIFKKTATGIGRGHSLGGLAGVVLGLNGTKMIDSGLTGFVASRSLATSSRRRETTTEEIVVPKVLFKREDLLDRYLAISRDVFNAAGYFKEKFGKLAGVETFNKVIPYNNPADLFIVLPLDSLATLQFEARQDKLNVKGNFLPRELHDLANRLENLTEEAGAGIMYKQRIEVPRDTYLHYTVFKDPSNPNSALELAQMYGMPTEPLIVKCEKDFSQGFLSWLDRLKDKFRITHRTQDPTLLASMARVNMRDLHSFVNEYNDAVRIKVIDTLSWRVWSEQKRHATLRQNVESVYSAVDRAYETMKELWPVIETSYHERLAKIIPIEKLDKVMTIDEKLKRQPELLIPYVYHTARQLMFYGKLVEEGFEKRDALYIVPKNIRLRTSETYDLINLIDLELPLRLCSTCEPERYATSWEKRKAIADAVPEISYFLHPKCNIGFCTEGKLCHHIRDLRDYDNELHKQVQQEMLGSAREKI